MCFIDPTTSAMPLVGTNHLQENDDKFLAGQPPRIGCQDDHLLPELPLLPSIGEDVLESRMTSIQEREDDEDITPSHTIQGEEDHCGHPTRLHHGGGPV
jgi:hypothetical protein